MTSKFSYRPHFKVCPVCDRKYITRWPNISVRCPDCQKIANEERYQESLRKKREFNADTMHDDATIEIVYDPLPWDEGGFKPGAKLAFGHLEDMLKLGGLVTGTQFVRKGKRYQVVKGKRIEAIR